MSGFFRFVLAGVLSLSCACCFKPLPDNQAPQILPLPEIVMGLNQVQVLNLALYSSDDSDFGQSLSWTISELDQAFLRATIEPETQHLTLFSANQTGLIAIDLILCDSKKLCSEPARLKVEIKNSDLVSEGEATQTFTLSLNVYPPQAGEIITDLSGPLYPASTVLSLNCLPVEDWEFDHWEGSVNNAWANPTQVVMFADLTISAICKQPEVIEGEVIPECDIDSPDNFFTLSVELVDANFDNELSWLEFKSRFVKLRDAYQVILMSFDTDENNRISRSEFVESLLPSILISAVGKPDVNEDNVLTYQEVTQIVKEITPEEFQRADQNRNGVIDCADLEILFINQNT